MNTSYIILIPLFPLMGFFINGLIALQQARGRGFVSKAVTSVIACAGPLLSFILVVKAFLFLKAHADVPSISISSLLDWMVIENTFTVTFGFVIDHLSVIMLLVVTGVGFLIHVYSTAYMKEDVAYARYMAYINLFLFFMITLVMADSLLFLFVGWEGVGLCSYFLIGFWFDDADKAQAGKKAFIVNRIGDFGFMIGMFLIVALCLPFVVNNGDVVYDTRFLNFDYLKANASILAPYAGLITLLLFFGATGKSAQIPLYVWLPDAMAGPTPVSALIHAATMVTAGIYMIARLHFLFVLAPATMNLIAAVGLATAFFAALIGVTQYDIKKVLAYSTVSQLGYMFLALGVGGFSAAVFHLATHAFFKACLFLGAGSVIRALHHEQDIRHMGGLFKSMRVTAITFLISVFAIAGVPPFSGFFSKDEILYLVYAKAPHPIFYVLALVTAGITAFYMMRLFAYTFCGPTRYPHPEKIHESPWAMTLPLIILAVLSTVAGFAGLPHIFGHNWLGDWLQFLGQKTPLLLPGPWLEGHLMVVSAAWAGLCLLVAFFLYRKNLHCFNSLKKRFAFVYQIIADRFRVDELYACVIIKPVKWFSDVVLFKIVDERLIDGFAVDGTGYTAQFLAKGLAVLQSGFIGHYLFYLLIGLFAVLIALVVS